MNLDINKRCNMVNGLPRTYSELAVDAVYFLIHHANTLIEEGESMPNTGDFRHEFIDEFYQRLSGVIDSGEPWLFCPPQCKLS